jgi:ribosomal protein S18 acetylase RimI-like enzyme
MIDLSMEIDLNKTFPEAYFPNEYIFKSITREQGYLWERVMDLAFGDYQPGTFEKILVENYGYLPERVFILFDEKGIPCGTASAWSYPFLWGEKTGSIIFVGVIPSHRGNGLGTEMVHYLCNVIKDRGETFSQLGVDNENLPAIKSYLNAGFIPRLSSKEQLDLWNEVFVKLNISAPKFSLEVRPPMDNPHPPRPYLLDLREQGFSVR